MDTDVQAFVNALREQFGDDSVFHTKALKDKQATVLFTAPDRSIIVNFKATIGDVVPIRAVDVHRGDPVDPGAIYHLAKANIRSGGMVRLAFLNGINSGEDDHLAQSIEQVENEIRATHG